ncbi:MAG: TolC family protein [Bdellovibrionales bacterium]|nr:TolC family protein [Bdellovibrionales bacterium]
MSLFKKAALAMVMTLAPMGALAVEDPCVAVNNANQMVLCAESRSPEVLKAESYLNSKKAAVGQSSQLLNPELSSEYVAGKNSGQNQSEFDVSLAFPIEVGGGRSARKSLAESEVKKAEAELTKVRAEVRKQVILHLTRLRQLYEEAEMVDESIAVFSKLVRQYQQRPKLSPEQEVTVEVFDLAKSDYVFKKQEIIEEITKIDSFFKLSLGKPLADFKLNLPARVKNWPEISEKSEKINSSPLLAIYEAEVGMSQAELAKARSEVFPALSVGPSMKRVSDGDVTSSQVGINFSMPLPLLSLNQGGRATAAANVKTAEVRRDFALTELHNLRETLFKQYVSSVRLLKASSSGLSQEKRHKKIEGHFYRGLVPSSLVIEAHRSLVEFEKTRNERELKTLENYLDIRFIDGEAMEFAL